MFLQNCADFSSCCDMTICKYFNSSTLCRPSNSSCDVPDFCFGNSSLCPNQYIADGQPCQTGKGSSFCLNSVCISPHDQCKSIFGPSMWFWDCRVSYLLVAILHFFCMCVCVCVCVCAVFRFYSRSDGMFLAK